ncbi:MAG: DJ-1/PfpI family protein [Chitinophagales bacterium]
MRGLIFIVMLITLYSCKEKSNDEVSDIQTENNIEQAPLKSLVENLPTIGLLAYEGVLMTEVTAPMDVFTKLDTAGNQLFNVIVIAETLEPIVTEEGLKIVPDYTFNTSPPLDALFVPSAYDMYTIIRNEEIISFIQEQNKLVDYVVSNCAGAQLIGQSGIAKGKKIVTWIGGGHQLQIDYPDLLVQDDASVTYVEDGKFSSSNGNLASYISSLELLEKLTDENHRKFVKSYLYLDRLQQWN